MELKNVYSYPKFKKINEAIDISNDAGWSETLIGSGINRLFSIFRKGLAMGIAAKTIQDMTTVLNGVIIDAKTQYDVENAKSFEEALSKILTIERIEKICNSGMHPDKKRELVVNAWKGYITIQKKDNNTETQKEKIENILQNLTDLGKKYGITLEDEYEGYESDDDTVKEKGEFNYSEIFNKKNIISSIEKLEPQTSVNIMKDDNLKKDFINLIHLYKIGRLYSNFFKAYDDKETAKKLDDALVKLDNLFNKKEIVEKKSLDKTLTDEDNKTYYSLKDENDELFVEIGKKYIELYNSAFEKTSSKINESVDYKINEGWASKVIKNKAEAKGEDVLNDFKSIFENKDQLKKIAQTMLERRRHKFTSLYLRFLRVAGLDVPEIVRSKMTPNFNINEADAQKANSFFETKLLALFDEYSDFFIEIEKINPKKLIKDNNLLSGIIADEKEKGGPGSSDAELANSAKAIADKEDLERLNIGRKQSEGLRKGQFGILVGSKINWYLVIKKVSESSQKYKTKDGDKKLHGYKIIDVLSRNDLNLNEFKSDEEDKIFEHYKTVSLAYQEGEDLFAKKGFNDLLLSNKSNLGKELQKGISEYFLFNTKNLNESEDKNNWFQYTLKDNILTCKGNQKFRGLLRNEHVLEKSIKNLLSQDDVDTDKQGRVSYPPISEGVYVIDDKFLIKLDKYNDMGKTDDYSQLIKKNEEKFVQNGFYK
jgi:hypothetical protein